MKKQFSADFRCNANAASDRRNKAVNKKSLNLHISLGRITFLERTMLPLAQPCISRGHLDDS